MSEFNWRQYFELAKSLSANKDEASLRTTVSRAYYFVYHLALARAKRNDYKHPAETGTHISLWKVYTASPVPDCQRLGTIGQRLFNKRLKADYEQIFPRLEELTQDVLHDAERFEESLSKLDLRHPKQSSQRR